jgi:hypothetical protein
MVNDEGQLYTLEGLSAALIMIVTMYLVLGTTSIYTPGDTHITDMQLEQIGSDVLEIMDTPNSVSVTGESELEVFIRNWDVAGFSIRHLVNIFEIQRGSNQPVTMKAFSIGPRSIT